MLELGLIILFCLIVAGVVLAALFFWGLKYAIILGINSVIGFFALYAIQAFVWTSLVINFWSVLIVAIGGLLGFLAVLLLHGIGIWF